MTDKPENSDKVVSPSADIKKVDGEKKEEGAKTSPAVSMNAAK